MSRASALARGRTAAELGMVDACDIQRVVSRTTDPTTGDVTPTWLVVYSGKCRVKQAQAQAQREDVGEDHLLLLRLEVQLPVAGSEGLQVGDAITITAAVNDADLAGRVFLIHDLSHQSEGTSRRVQCLERTGS